MAGRQLLRLIRDFGFVPALTAGVLAGLAVGVYLDLPTGGTALTALIAPVLVLGMWRVFFGEWAPGTAPEPGAPAKPFVSREDLRTLAGWAGFVILAVVLFGLRKLFAWLVAVTGVQADEESLSRWFAIGLTVLVAVGAVLYVKLRKEPSDDEPR